MKGYAKGPWTRDEYFQIVDISGDIIVLCGAALGSARGTPTAKTVAANSALITAAPEMYEALEKIAADDSNDKDVILSIARAAVEKINGGLS